MLSPNRGHFGQRPLSAAVSAHKAVVLQRILVRAGTFALVATVAAWVLLLLFVFVACPLSAPAPLPTDKFDPALDCQLQSLECFVWLSSIPCVLGVLAFPALTRSRKALFLLVAFVPCAAVWAYVAWLAAL